MKTRFHSQVELGIVELIQRKSEWQCQNNEYFQFHFQKIQCELGEVNSPKRYLKYPPSLQIEGIGQLC